MNNNEYTYEIIPRAADLGGGWNLELRQDGKLVGGGVYPVTEECDEKDAWNDAMERATEWLESRQERLTTLPAITDDQKQTLRSVIYSAYSAARRSHDAAISEQSDDFLVPHWAEQMQEAEMIAEALGLTDFGTLRQRFDRVREEIAAEDAAMMLAKQSTNTTGENK